MSSPTPSPCVEALQCCEKTAYITPSSAVSADPAPAQSASRHFDFPDGGRFTITLSAAPLTAFVDGHTGLPDSFLLEINNYIFSTLFAAAAPTAEHAVRAILRKADSLYHNFTVRQQHARANDSSSDDDEPPTQGSRTATAALMKQLSLLEGQDTRAEGFAASPRGDNLYVWKLSLYFDDPPLKDKLSSLGHDSLQLELRFPPDFPYAPPFVRVVAPYVKCRYVLPRGGICMQLFTTSGWTPANSIDAVCVQVRAMLLTGGIDVGKRSPRYGDYSYLGAKKDLESAVRQHRWDLKKGERRADRLDELVNYRRKKLKH